MWHMSHAEASRRRALLCVLAVTIQTLLLAFAAGEPTQAQKASGSEKLRSVADVVVVTDADADVIYVADFSGTIFYLKVARGELGARSYGDFKPLVTTAPEFPKPSGLAYMRGKLVGCDPEANACFEVDLTAVDPASGRAPKPKLIVRSRGLDRPKHVAVSESGELAVVSDTRVHYLVPGGEPKLLAEGLGDIDRLAFDGESLIVLDEQGDGELYAFDLGHSTLPWPLKLTFQRTKLLPAGVRKELPHIKDFALFRGVYYVAGTKALLILMRPQSDLSAEPMVLPVPLAPVGDINRVALSGDRIFVSDEAKGMFLIAPRPIPILVDFPRGTEPAVLTEQAEIIKSLVNRGSVPTRKIIAARHYDSVNDFVRGEVYAVPRDAPELAPSDLVGLSLLICELNGGWDCQKEPSAQGVRVLRRGTKIEEGSEVVIPSAAVRGYFDEKITGSEHESLERFLTGRGIIPLSAQTAPLSPGDIVRINDEQATPRLTGKCALEAWAGGAVTPVSSSPTFFGAEVKISPAEFAKQLGLQDAGRELQRLKVASVAVQYADVKFEKLALSPEDKGKTCLQAMPSSESSVVDRVLSAASASYRFLDRNGKTISVDPKKLTTLGFRGEPDPLAKGRWTVGARLNLGYSAFTFGPSSTQGLPIITYLEPATPTKRVYTQQLTMLVESAKAAGVLEELHGLAANSRTPFYAFSAQDYEIRGEKSAGGAERNAQNLQAALAARDKLRQLIKFPIGIVEDLGNLPIGIVEDVNTVDEYHECFFSDKEWAWGHMPPQPDPNRPKITGFHGTHVAAIIGAKSKLPGLAPTVRLVKINPDQLFTEMKARQKNVHIYNFSIDLSPEEDYTNLIARLKDGELGQHNMLLVVAAGNNMEDYGRAGATPPPPVSWLRSLPHNLIVVGASTSGDPQARSHFTDYSKKYVHIFAPGEDVYSAAGDNSYAPDSGASFAAPQVTAVAALLRSKYAGPWIKAVLIYTANWHPSLKDDVWGGVLNAERAITALSTKPNSIWTKGLPEPEFTVLADEGNFNITIKSGHVNDPNVKSDRAERVRDLKVSFSDVLRVQRLDPVRRNNGQEEGRFRIIYLDGDGTMRIIYNAVIEGSVKCTVSKVIKDGKDEPLTGDACRRLTEKKPGERGEFGLDRIDDYIAKPNPYNLVKFPVVVDAQQ